MRPFSEFAEVGCRSYSLPIQRRITDFGADVSFAKVSGKLKEHYAITVPLSSIRYITELHARNILETKELRTDIPDEEGESTIIVETDGTMIPIVETHDRDEKGEKVDRRKNRDLFWKEARLSIAINGETEQRQYEAVMGSPDVSGDHLAHCAICAGVGRDTHVHGVGDGATWIKDQMDRVFGEQGEYLIDFFHLDEYISSSAKTCATKAPVGWRLEQREKLLANKTDEVIQELKKNLESETIPNSSAPVRSCYNYMINRKGQFNYKGAIENNLPIGSGQIESAHRYVIQERLKIAGAWWKKSNAQSMLSLRVERENGNWNTYWDHHENNSIVRAA